MKTTRPFLQDRCCGVSDSFCILNSAFQDGSAASEGILHSVDVDAESLYEAVAIALPALVKTM